MEQPPADWRPLRASVLRNAAGIGVATGAYALSFGAVATAAGLSVLQTCALSLVMFTGASQFASRRDRMHPVPKALRDERREPPGI